LGIVGERVKPEDGPAGEVFAVAHAGGGAGTAGWQLLLLTDDKTIYAASAINAHLRPPEEALAGPPDDL